MVEIVNAVGSGVLNTEIDLYHLSSDHEIIDYQPEEYHGAFVNLPSGRLVILYRTGSFIIRGGNSKESLYHAKDEFINLCREWGIINNEEDFTFNLNNLVCTYDFEDNISLEKIIIELGLESTEYEPEQFPGLIYRPKNSNCTILIFNNGKIVITGEKNIDNIKAAVDSLQEKIK